MKSLSIVLLVLLLMAPCIAVDSGEIKGYTIALLDANGFPGAYSDDEVLYHGIANGQTVVNTMAGISVLIQGEPIPMAPSLIILHNMSSSNPTQAEVNETGKALCKVAKAVKNHFTSGPEAIDFSLISVRVNPPSGPFGNNKPHFDGSTFDGSI